MSDDPKPVPAEQPGASRRKYKPHRAELLLYLSYGALVCTWLTPLLLVPGVLGALLGAVVWLLASRDLAKMRAGLMERHGRRQTRKARGFAILAVVAGLVMTATCTPVWFGVADLVQHPPTSRYTGDEFPPPH
jgi:4-hydroxybenzoate polyprenyltransferase